ncbi:MAG: hypothetical protein LBK29_04005 [Oscillospiraceae bacterium]|jgi:site-specific DNA-methyltransferase (adenine-specific)|nr:hypothetical protein [Oscillospiraceae bacterium]
MNESKQIEIKEEVFRKGENVLYYGDNLEIMRKYIPSESVDLCYIDPPFCSGRDYYMSEKDKGKNSEKED